MSDVLGDAPLDWLFGSEDSGEPYDSPGENYVLLGYVPLDASEKYLAGIYVDLSNPADELANADPADLATFAGISFLEGLDEFSPGLELLDTKAGHEDFERSDYRGSYSNLMDAYNYVEGTWLAAHSVIIYDDGEFHVYATDDSN